MLIPIHDLGQPELLFYTKLNEHQLSQYNAPNPLGYFIAESPKVIARALNADYTPVSMLLDKDHIDAESKALLDLLPETLPIYTASDALLTSLTGFHLTRGALCLFKRKETNSIEKICALAKRIAILEDIVNPTNVGAIFRNAAALHIDAILLTKNCSDPLYRRCLRVSMGNVFQIPWGYIDSDYLKEIKDLGFCTVAMALVDNSISIDNPILKTKERLAIILGNEGNGLSLSTLQSVDYNVIIPMATGIDSLNVAAASAIAFWELQKKELL